MKVQAKMIKTFTIKEGQTPTKAQLDEVKEAVRTVSEDVKAEIQSRAPVKTGKYKKSWTVTKVEETAQSLVNTVHSAKHYRLTHLLENGHAKRGGGRTRSFPHIAPGEALAEKELLEIAERKLRG